MRKHARKRRLLYHLTASLLLLCVAVLWIRSCWRADCVLLWNTRCELSCESRAGYLAFRSSNMHGDGPSVYWLTSSVGAGASERRAMRRGAGRSFMGFFCVKQTAAGSSVRLAPELERRGLKTPAGILQQELFYVPFWAVGLLIGLPAVLFLRRIHGVAQRRVRGLCPVCGYDVRATPARCPECGSEPAATTR
jgi:hypothetical protein